MMSVFWDAFECPLTLTVKNKYPLPLISELVFQLCGTKYFTKLDICWGFNNIHIKPGDEWKVAFCTNCGLFEPLVMFFVSQTSFGHIFTNSSTIPTVSERA